jgi:hypothetical protein
MAIKQQILMYFKKEPYERSHLRLLLTMGLEAPSSNPEEAAHNLYRVLSIQELGKPLGRV